MRSGEEMSKKAMVVDNDFFFVEFLSEVLEKRGYAVIKAYDGKEAISQLEHGPVDLLFTDMVMPKIDGKELIYFARKKFPDTAFPIIAVSGTLVERLDTIKEIGADYYIAKGPMEGMADHLHRFMDRIEKEPLNPDPGSDVFEPGRVYPRQATVELIESVNFQRAIIESVGVGIIVVDKDARIISANPPVLDIINRSSESLLNSPVTAIFPARDKERLVSHLKKVLHDPAMGKSAFYTTMCFRDLCIIVSPLQVEGRISGWILVMEETGQWAEQA